MTRPQRYALRRRLRAGMEKLHKPPQRVPPPAPDKADFVRDALGVMGVTADDDQIAAILRGTALKLDGDVVQLRRGVLDVRPERQYCRTCCREINAQTRLYLPAALFVRTALSGCVIACDLTTRLHFT